MKKILLLLLVMTLPVTMKAVEFWNLLNIVEIGNTSSGNYNLTCPDNHHPHMIDLGLPSGTKWACCNLDTTNPENQSPTNYGGYYAWGELKEQVDYSDETYEFYQDGGYMDIGSDIAGTQYDVAHMKWGGDWRMPTYEQCMELINNCTYKYTKINGVDGAEFIGSNGGRIFLPAAGFKSYGGLGCDGNGGYYSSSTESDSYSALGFNFDTNGTNTDYGTRRDGHSVRPVILQEDERNAQSLSWEGFRFLAYGDEAYTLPETTDQGQLLTWTSSNESVVTINGNTLTTIGIGNVTITATQEGNDEYRPFSKVFSLLIYSSDPSGENDLPLNWGSTSPWGTKYVFQETIEGNSPPADSNGKEWYEVGYDDSSWGMLIGPISRGDYFGVGEGNYHNWSVEGDGNGGCFYLRRTFSVNLSEVNTSKIWLQYQVDDDADFYLNGEHIHHYSFSGSIGRIQLPSDALVDGINTLAIYVCDYYGEAYIDYSIGDPSDDPSFFSPYQDEQGVWYEYNVGSEEWAVTSQDCWTGDFIIPATIMDKSVTSIRDFVFSGGVCNNITLPEGLRSIGYEAFGDGVLTSLSIPASVTEIGGSITKGCASLSSLTVANGNIVYDSRDNCNAIILTNENKVVATCPATTLPASVTIIGNGAFRGSSISKFTIPETITYIEDDAFSECPNLEQVTVMSETPCTLGESAFPDRSNQILLVQTGCKEAYQNAPYWQDFAYIFEVGEEVAVTMGYAYLSDEGTTLNFVYDDQFFFRKDEGVTVYKFDEPEGEPRWMDGTNSNISHVVFDASFADARPTTTHSWIREMPLESIEGIEYLNTSEVTNMDAMFYGTASLTSVDFTHFDTSNVTNFSYMFYGCSGLTSLDLSMFDTSKAECSDGMFAYSGLKELTLSASMSNLSYNACEGVGSEEEPCILIVTNGFDFGDIDTSTSTVMWKGGLFGIEVNGHQQQTLSLKALPTMTYGDDAYSLPDSTDQGLTLIWTSSDENVATISGNILTAEGAGTATITATQEGNEEYLPFSMEYTLTVTSASSATCSISVIPVTLHTGKTASVSIGLDNEEALIAFEFYLQLPNGIRITEDADGYPEVTLNSERSNRHILDVEKESNGLYHILCYSNSNNAFNGNSGELLSFDITCDDGLEAGDYQATVSTVKFADVNEDLVRLADYSFDISVIDYVMGDVNGDNDIDVMDVVTMVGYIMGRNPASFIFAAADHTGDGAVDVMDLVRQVNLVMSQPISGAPEYHSFDALGSGLSLVTDRDGAVHVTLADGKQYVATQFVVSLSEGQQLVGINSDRGHRIGIEPLSDNRFFVMSYSGDNAAFTTNEEALTLQVKGRGTVSVEGAAFVDADSRKVLFQDASSVTTGIDENTVNLISPTDIYSPNGMLIRKDATTTEGLRSGLYIINGKKHIKK